MKKFKTSVSLYVVNNPIKLILLSLALIFVSVPQLLHLQSDYGARVWFRTTDPLIKDLDELEQKFGNDERIIIAVHSEKGIFQKANIETVQRLTEKLWLVPNVVRVDSIANYSYSDNQENQLETLPFIDEEVELGEEYLKERKEIAKNDPVLNGNLVSDTGHIAMVYGTLSVVEKGSSLKHEEIVKVLTKTLEDELKLNPDISFHPVGASSFSDAFRQVNESDIISILPIATILMAIILFYIFRNLMGVLIPLGLVFVVILMTLAMGAFFGFKFNNMTFSIPGILLAICLADAIHILSTFYRAISDGEDKKKAVFLSLKKNLVPTLMTSISTMIGFFSLVSTDLQPVQHLGILSGVGTAFAWILSIFLVCPLLLYLPTGKVKVTKSKSSHYLFEKYSAVYCDWVEKNKNIIFYSISGGAVVLLLLSFNNKVNSEPRTWLSDALEISRDLNFVSDNFGGVGGPHIVIDSGGVDQAKSPEFLRKVDQYKQWLESYPDITKVTSITDTIKELNKSLNNGDSAFQKIPATKEQIAELLLLYSMGLPEGVNLNDQISLDNRHLRLVVMWKIFDSERSLYEMKNFELKAEELGLNVKVTGKPVLFHRMSEYIVESFFSSMSIALVLISILLILLLNSWRLGGISLLPNVVPLIFGGGIMAIFSMNIDMVTSMVMAVCLGIAVDDTIHFLAHYRDQVSEEKSPQEAMKEIISHTAPALIFTTLTLVICFGCFIFADYVPNVNFGILCAIILSMAIVIDLIYLPALLFKFNVRK